MGQDYLSVTDLTRKIKRLIDGETGLQNIWIRAEISNYKYHSRGHMYFTLKDESARINAVMFAGNNRFLKFRPENGMNVLVRGDTSVYEPHGVYQFYVKEMQPDGIGSLYLAYEELKKKLEIAGFFSATRKKQIPPIPKEIAVITSPTGAAVRDIITTVQRRFPLVNITLLPVLVQGPEAAPSIAQAIANANAIKKFDVMIVGRGGGSLEELWAFNEQIVAEAIYESRIPVISAVGHETDVTISDFVADLRAPTPTAAAELAVPDILELRKSIIERKLRLQRAMHQRLAVEKERLNFLAKSYAFRYPKQLIDQKEQDLDRLVEAVRRETFRILERKSGKLTELLARVERVHPKHRLHDEKMRVSKVNKALSRAIKQTYDNQENKFVFLLSKLEVLSPLNMMKRGYSLVYGEQEQIVKQVDDAPVETTVTIQLQDGQLLCLVQDKTYGELPNGNWSDGNDDGK
ncbi:exodeoxyribonuclease VII large subunit [Evansella caseinilytica]|uniref:Exodeoxyribonuclease 7 large subunit n=1 Tax=Evansella caseinilytica TaxID=1503961 RepID=A0A1H3KY89_9BACI|nr:exodeoxyribonuclease VII large subunit [Evansella caseinilytica]SDY56604.1 exodeoxyribonuclease VII large subunit [Evansella caseinilytica]